MSEIRIIIYLILTSMAFPGWAQEAALPDGVQACFDTPERLERLACYDRVLQRPGTIDAATLAQVDPVSPIQKLAQEKLSRLVSSPYRSAGGVYLSLFDQTSDQALGSFGGDTALDDLNAKLTDEEFEPLRLSSDLYLSLPGLGDIGEKATLVLSCQNDITHLQVFWPDGFSNSVEPVRLYYGTSVSDPTDHEDRRFRVRGGGVITENARGLDSIRLAQKMARTQRTQFSVSEGETVRSAFFDTALLEPVLPLIARHCSWITP